ncbi:MAG TPA: hypothetical protein VFH14_09270 [Gemmatimonadaceae bacterium]|nr:hypothetical protein [Gemmatimonadaceae bacterium]
MSWRLRVNSAIVIPLLTASIATAQEASSAAARVAFRELLSVGQVSVTNLTLGAPPRFTELVTRLQQAARANQEWWTAHVRSAPEGQPLPYDARMGVSEAEYREMLQLADSVVMQRAEAGAIRVSSLPHGWRLDGGTAFAELNGIDIDTVARVVRTPFGELREFNIVEANDDQRATGRWTGPQWKLTQVDEATGDGVAASFVLGKLEANNRTLLYFDAKRARNGQIAERAFRMLELMPPPARP